MTSSPTPTFEIDAGRIGWITFDDPDRSMNVLTEQVMLRFGETLDEARAAAREGRLTALAIRYDRVTLTLVVLTVIAGLFAYQSLPKAQDPGFIVRTAVITTQFPGASPERIERHARKRETWIWPITNEAVSLGGKARVGTCLHDRRNSTRCDGTERTRLGRGRAYGCDGPVRDRPTVAPWRAQTSSRPRKATKRSA